MQKVAAQIATSMMFFSIQILTNAALRMPTVTLMQLAQILTETSPALVMLAGLEVERLVQVTLSYF